MRRFLDASLLCNDHPSDKQFMPVSAWSEAAISVKYPFLEPASRSLKSSHHKHMFTIRLDAFKNSQCFPGAL